MCEELCLSQRCIFMYKIMLNVIFNWNIMLKFICIIVAPFWLSCIGKGNGSPLQCSCLENPRTGEPGRLPSVGSHRVGHNWSDLAAAAAVLLFRETQLWERSLVFSLLAVSSNKSFLLIFSMVVLAQYPSRGELWKKEKKRRTLFSGNTRGVQQELDESLLWTSALIELTAWYLSSEPKSGYST